MTSKARTNSSNGACCAYSRVFCTGEMLYIMDHKKLVCMADCEAVMAKLPAISVNFHLSDMLERIRFTV